MKKLTYSAFGLLFILLSCNKVTSKGIGPIDTQASISPEHILSENPKLDSDTLQATKLFQIPLAYFFTQGQSDTLPFDQSKIEFLFPTKLFVTNDQVYIPNKWNESIDIYTQEGGFLKEISYKGHEIDLVDFVIGDNMCLISNRQGLFILNLQNELRSRSEKVTKVFTPNFTDNIYIYSYSPELNSGMYNDQNGIVEELVVDKYSSAYSSDTILTVIRMLGDYFDGNFILEKRELPEGKKFYSKEFEQMCIGCFDFPQMISNNLLIASNINLWNDQLYHVKDTILIRKELVIPVEIDKKITSLEYAEYAPTGISYSYFESQKKLYAVVTDMENVTVLIFDLLGLDH